MVLAFSSPINCENGGVCGGGGIWYKGRSDWVPLSALSTTGFYSIPFIKLLIDYNFLSFISSKSCILVIRALRISTVPSKSEICLSFVSIILFNSCSRFLPCWICYFCIWTNFEFYFFYCSLKSLFFIISAISSDYSGFSYTVTSSDSVFSLSEAILRFMSFKF